MAGNMIARQLEARAPMSDMKRSSLGMRAASTTVRERSGIGVEVELEGFG